MGGSFFQREEFITVYFINNFLSITLRRSLQNEEFLDMWILGRSQKKLLVCKNQKGGKDNLPLEEPIRLRISKR